MARQTLEDHEKALSLIEGLSKLASGNVGKTSKYEAPSQSSDIHYIELTSSNAADMLRVTAHAILKVSGVNGGEAAA